MMMFARRMALAAGLALLGASAAFADSHVYKLYVDGLACPFCAYGVEKKVGELDGVEKVDIDIDAGVVSVTLKGNASLSEDVARVAVSEAGFSLRKFEAPGQGS